MCSSDLEEAEVGDIPKVVDKYRALGGYLRRYRGGPLNRFREPHDEHNDPLAMALDEMCVLAFLEVNPLPPSSTLFLG